MFIGRPSHLHSPYVPLVQPRRNDLSQASQKIGHGPPPHAPAHGHRRKCPDGFEVVYDSASGVYVVVGYPSHYYLAGHYYRFHEDHWQISVSFKGTWQHIGKRPLPPGLKAKAVKNTYKKDIQAKAKAE